jgi:hypothetical protein
MNPHVPNNRYDALKAQHAVIDKPANVEEVAKTI